MDTVTTANAELELSEFVDTIEVVADKVTVDTTKTLVDTNVDFDLFDTLPNDRSYSTIIAAAAGTRPGNNVQVSGGADDGNVYLVDGVDTTDPIWLTWGTQLNIDIIDEISVQRAGYSAEYGRSSGGIINMLTKSGGNELSILARVVIADSDWSSDWGRESETGRQKAGAARVDEVRPSISIGGPILKDRLWFFTSYEKRDMTRDYSYYASKQNRIDGDLDTGEFFYKGHFLSVQDATGARTSYTWDDCSRLTGVETPSGNRKAYRYDAQDRLVEYQDEGGGRTSFTYTGIDRIAERTGPDGATLRYSWDTEEQFTGVVNQRGEAYEIVRDYAGRVIEEKNYWGQKTTYRYDAAGRLVSSTDPSDRVTAYEYDIAGRLVEKEYEDESVESFEYDMAGNLLSHRNGDISVTRVFDKEHRIIKETFGEDFVLNAYDLNGRRIKRRSSHGNRVRHHFDAAGRLSGTDINGQRILNIERNLQARTVTEQLGSMDREYHFDITGRLKHQRVTADTLGQVSHADGPQG
jgi:YD repeat-containing protein